MWILWADGSERELKDWPSSFSEQTDTENGGNFVSSALKQSVLLNSLVPATVRTGGLKQMVCGSEIIRIWNETKKLQQRFSCIHMGGLPLCADFISSLETQAPGLSSRPWTPFANQWEGREGKEFSVIQSLGRFQFITEECIDTWSRVGAGNEFPQLVSRLTIMPTNLALCTPPPHSYIHAS